MRGVRLQIDWEQWAAAVSVGAAGGGLLTKVGTWLFERRLSVQQKRDEHIAKVAVKAGAELFADKKDQERLHAQMEDTTNRIEESVVRTEDRIHTLTNLLISGKLRVLPEEGESEH
jgi:hypothetical protein